MQSSRGMRRCQSSGDLAVAAVLSSQHTLGQDSDRLGLGDDGTDGDDTLDHQWPLNGSGQLDRPGSTRGPIIDVSATGKALNALLHGDDAAPPQAVKTHHSQSARSLLRKQIKSMASDVARSHRTSSDVSGTADLASANGVNHHR